MSRTAYVLCVAVILSTAGHVACSALRAQSDAPVLSELQRAALAVAILTRDNAQLRLDALVKELTVPGYELTTNGDYVPTPKKEPE